MKFVIITQVANQENRIYDWIKYHKFLGFDTFIIFDDYSKDNTKFEIEKAINDFKTINIIVQKTNKQGNFYDIESCKNSNSYGGDMTLQNRLNTSYTRGNDIVKSVNPDAICTFLDVDEFIYSNSESLQILEKTFEETNCHQIKLFNFDVLDNYILEKNFLFKNNFVRWDFIDTFNHPIWKGRTKAIFKSKFLEVCTFVHHPVHGPTVGNDIPPLSFDDLRMLHFRKPNLEADSIKFVTDINFNNYLKKINLL